MKLALVLAIAACGSKDTAAPAPAPAAAPDHQLHRTDTPHGVTINGKAVPLASQPTMDWIGLPMSGDIDVAVNVQNIDDLRNAVGTIAISCPAGCRLGDDKAKLVPANPRASAFAGDGLYVGHIDFDRFDIGITVAGGKATITKWQVVSKDLELVLGGGAELGRTLGESRVDACLRFKGTPALEQRDPKTAALIAVTGAARAADGMYNIQLTDRFDTMKRLARICDGSTPPPDPPTLAYDPTSPPVTDPAVTAPPVVDPNLDAKTTALIASAITKKSDTSYDVNAKKWQQLVADPMALAKGGRIVPAVKNGKPIGFKLYALKPESLPAKLGLQNGDTVMAIGGQPMTSADKALEFYTSMRDLKKGDTVTLELERKGAPLTFTYTLR